MMHLRGPAAPTTDSALSRERRTRECGRQTDIVRLLQGPEGTTIAQINVKESRSDTLFLNLPRLGEGRSEGNRVGRKRLS